MRIDTILLVDFARRGAYNQLKGRYVMGRGRPLKSLDSLASRDTITTSVVLKVDLAEALRNHVQELGMSQSEYIRRLLRADLEQKQSA